MPDFDLTITICSWNTVSDLRACCESLKQAKDEACFEVLIVDNGSVDGSPAMVKEEFPDFRLLAQSENLGFTGGHNLAIQERQGRDVALLNSDTLVHQGAIRKLVEAMELQPEVGVFGPKLLNPDGSLQYSCRRFPNPIAAAFRNTFLGKLFPNNKYVRTYLMHDFDHSQPCEVDWVSGAAMFIRGEVVDRIGSLDPSFFMYCEDTDFCKRTWQAGFKVMYIPDAVVTHAIGRSTDRVANKMIVRFHRSMFRYTQKHLIGEVWLPFRPIATMFVAGALSARALAFLARNWRDAIVRKLKRQ